ncbi:MAG: ABC transporter ATP-binding protein [Armatimonadota bacterium]
MALVEIKDLIKRYPMGRTEFTALKDINLSFEKGEFTGVIGPSGSGKTTLLNIIGALDVPSSGNVSVMGKDVGALSHNEASELRNEHLGFIFQTYNLFPVYNVYENIEFPLLLRKVSPDERKKKIMKILDILNMTDKVASKPPQLSGGEAQRVAIARAVVKGPEIILADEPTANLDADNSHAIMRMMVGLNKEFGTTFIFSTHDQKVMEYLNRKISLVDGSVAKDEER